MSRYVYRSTTGRPIYPREMTFFEIPYKGYSIIDDGEHFLYDEDKDLYWGIVIINGGQVEFVVDFIEDLQFAFERVIDCEIDPESLSPLPKSVWVKPKRGSGVGIKIYDEEIIGKKY